MCVCVCVCVCVCACVSVCLVGLRVCACKYVRVSMFVLSACVWISIYMAMARHSMCSKEALQMCRVGQNRIYTPYMTVYLVISLPKILYIHRIYTRFWPTLQMWHYRCQQIAKFFQGALQMRHLFKMSLLLVVIVVGKKQACVVLFTSACEQVYVHLSCIICRLCLNTPACVCTCVCMRV